MATVGELSKSKPLLEIYRGAWVIAYREVLRVFYERSSLVGLFLMPIMVLVVFGIGFNSMVGSLTPEVNYIKFLFPGVIAMNLIFTSLRTGGSIVWDREHGFLKELLVSPVSRVGIVMGKAAGGATISMGNTLLLLILAPVVGTTVGVTDILKLLPIIVIMSISLSGLGIILATRISSQRGYNVLQEITNFPLIFLSGTFFPITSLPTWLEAIAKLNPVTYGVDAIRQVLIGDPVLASATPSVPTVLGITLFGHPMGVLTEVSLLGTVGLVLISVATWTFNRQE